MVLKSVRWLAVLLIIGSVVSLVRADPTYSISGTITSASGPVAGVTVTAVPGGATGVTNASGVFTISGLAANTYTIAPSSGSYVFTPSLLTVVVTAADVTGQNFSMWDENFESGGLTQLPWVQGTPALPWSVVTSDKHSGTFAARSYPISTSGIQNSDLELTLNNRAAGTLKFWVKVTTNDQYNDILELQANDGAGGAWRTRWTWDSTIPWTQASITTLAGTYTYRWRWKTNNSGNYATDGAWIDDITLPPAAYSLSGSVHTSSGTPLAGVTIAATGASTASTTTDASGNYSFPTLAAGSYTLTPSKTGYSTFAPASIPVTLSANTSGQDFTAVTYTVSGTVTLGASPLANVTVAATGTVSKSAVTNASGAYTIIDLPPASYTIAPAKVGYSFSPTSWGGLVNADLTSINFDASTIPYDEDWETGGITKWPWATGSPAWTVQSTTVLTGTYAAKAGAPGPSGTSYIEVTLNRAAGSISFYRKVLSEAAPGQDGLRFKIDGVEQNFWQGNQDWAPFQYTVNKGIHTYRWEFVKDATTDVTGEGAWLDNINFPPPVFTVTGTVTKAVGGALGGVTITPSAESVPVTTATDGTYTVVNMPAGDYTFAASKTGYTFEPAPRNVHVGSANVTGQDFTAFGVPTQLSISTQPVNSRAGDQIPLKVTALDAFGDTATKFTGQITLAVKDNPGSDTLHGDVTINAVLGVADFTVPAAKVWLEKVGTAYTLEATATGLTSATTSAFDITNADPDRLSFTQQPTNTVAGDAMAPAVQVTIYDRFGNVARVTDNVTLTIENNAGSGTLTGGGPVAAVNGVATFSAASIQKVGTGYTLRATSNALFVVSTGFNITPAAKDHVTFTQQPTTTAAGEPVAPAIGVTIFDRFDNVVPVTDDVGLTIQNNAGGGTLSGGTAIPAVNGVATFSAVSIDKTGVGYTLKATSGTMNVVSSAFNITSAPPHHLAFTQQPTHTVAGNNITPALQVTIYDRFDNVANVTDNVGLTIENNAGSGTLTGGTAIPAVAGVAMFNGVSINKVGTGYTLKATSGALNVVSSAFNISSAMPDHLVFTQQPTNAVAGVAIAPAVQVTIYDRFDNVANVTDSIGLTIQNNAGSGTLSGGTAIPAVAGVSAFPGASIDKAGTGYTLKATSGTLNVISSAFNIAPAAAHHLVIAQQPSANAIAGVAFPQQPVVQVRDQFENLVAGTGPAVDLAVTGGTATLQGTTSVSATDGVAAFAGLNIQKAGTFTLTASSGTLPTVATDAIAVLHNVPHHLGFTQQPTNTVAGEAMAPAVQVTIYDQYNNIATVTNNVGLTIENNPSSGILVGGDPVAAVAGVATFPGLRINKVGTGYTLKAGSGTLNVVSSALDITSAAPHHLVFTQQPTNAVAGASVTPAVQVTIYDQFDNVANVTDNVGLTIENNAGSGTLTGGAPVAAVAGVATFPGVSIQKVGTGYTLKAGSGTLNVVSSAFNITSAAPDHLVFTQQPTNTVAGDNITPAVQVTIYDRFDNVANVTDNVGLTIESNPGSGTLSGGTAIPAVAGVAMFNGVSINKVGTGYTLKAGSGTLNVVSSAFNIASAAPDHLVFTQQPTNTVAGASITPAVRVTIYDRFDNVANVTDNVGLTIENNAGSGTLSGGTAIPAVAGVATFPNASIDKVGTGYTIEAASGTLSVYSAAFNITPGPAHHLVITQQPSANAIAGVAFPQQPVVQVRDQFENLVAGTGPAVDLAVTGGTATLQGTTSVSATDGVAAFAGLNIQKAGTFTLTASSGTLPTVATDAIAVLHNVPHHLGFTQQPTNTVAGEAMTPAVQVTIYDQYNNVATVTNSVGLTIENNPSSGILVGGDPVAAVAGVATFPGLRINKAGTGYTLKAASGTLNVVSSAFSIGAGAKDHLAFSQQPSSAVAGDAIAPAIQVAILDSFGNVVPVTDNVGLTIENNAGSGTLTGGTAVPAVNGVATFSAASINKTGAGYTLKATSGTLNVVSTPFNITPGAPHHLAFSRQPSATATAGQVWPQQPIVQIQDRLNNLVDTASAPIFLTATGQPGVLLGIPFATAVGGVADFTMSSLQIQKAGTFTLTASTGVGVADAVSDNILISPAGANHLAVLQQPSATATAGVAFGQQPTVEVLDQYENRVTGSGPTVTMAVTADAAPLFPAGSLSVAAADGVAAFTGLNIHKAGTFRLTASSTGMTVVNTNQIVVGHAAADHLSFATQPSATATAGAPFAQQPTVEVRDAYENLVTDSTVPVALATGAPNFLLPDPAGVNATNGVAAFTGLNIRKAGSYTLTATSAPLGSATSTQIVVADAGAHHLTFTTQPSSSATAGVPFGQQPVVEVRDLYENRVAGSSALVTLVTGAPNRLVGTNAVNALNGVATFTGLHIDKVGTFTLSASSGTLVGADSDPINVGHGVAHHVAFTTQPSATATAGALFAQQPVVEVQDEFNNRIVGSTLEIALVTTGTTNFLLPAPATMNASNGVANFTGLSIQKAGGYTLTASATGVLPAVSTQITVNPAAAHHLAITQQPSANAIAGAAFAQQPVIEVRDQFENPMAGTGPAVALAVTGGTATLQGTTSVSATDGVAAFAGLNIQKAGTFTLTASSGTLPTVATNSITVLHDVPHHLGFTQQPTNTVAGEAMAPAVQVTIYDQYNNIATVTNNVGLVIDTNPSSGILVGGDPVAAVAGVATFSGLRINKVGAGYTLKAASGALNVVSSAFNISSAPPHHLVFTQQPTNAVAGASITPAVQVTIYDQFDNVANVTDNVGLTIENNAGSGTLTGGGAIPAVAGVATFGGVSINKAGTGYTLKAGSGTLNLVSTTFNITPAPADHLVIAQQPSATATAGMPFAQQPIIEVRDQFENLVAGTGPSVSLAVTGGTATLQGGATSISATDGVASFGGLTIEKAGSFTLTASSGTLPTAATGSIVVSSGAPHHLVFTQQPTNTAAGANVTPAVRVTLYDQFDNVANVTDNVGLTIENNPSGGTLTGGAPVAAVAGVATFPGVSIQKAGTGYTMKAASGTLNVVSGAFNITAGTPHHLGYPQQPTNTTAGAAMTPAVSVAIYDQFNNVVPVTDNVGLTIENNPVGGTLTGGAPVAAVAGVATFPGVSINKVGNGYTLKATSGTLVSTSAAFDIAAGPASKLVFTVQPSTTPVAATIIPAVQVAIQDANGNPVTGATNQVALAIADNPGGGTLTGGDAVAATGGIATFAGLSIDKSGLGYTLSATSTGLTPATSVLFDITSAQPDLLIKSGEELDAAYAINDVYQETPAGDQVQVLVVNPNQTATYHVKVQNDGNISRSFWVKAAETPETGWLINYLVGTTDVSAEFAGAGHQTRALDAGQSEIITVQVKPTNQAAAGSSKSTVLSVYTLATGAPVKDAVQATTWVYGYDMADLLIKQSAEGDGAYAVDDGYQWMATGDQVENATVVPGAAAVYNVKVQNDGNSARTFVVKAVETPGTGWTTSYMVGTTNISSGILAADGYATASLAPGASEIITVSVTPGLSVGGGEAKKVDLKVSADAASPGWYDVVQMNTSVSANERGDLLIKKGSELDSAYGVDNVYQTAPAGEQVRVEATNPNVPVAYQVKVQNDGSVARTFVVKAQESAESGWAVTYKSGATDITTAVLGAGYTTTSLAAGATEVITVEMKALASSTPGTSKTTVVKLSQSDSAVDAYDAVQATTWVFGFEAGDLLVKQAAEDDSAYAIDNEYQWFPQGAQVRQMALNPNQVAAYNVKVQNDGNVARTFVVKAGETAETGWVVTYKSGATDITDAVKGAGYTTASLAGGASEVLTVEMKPTVTAAAGTAKTTVLKLFMDGAAGDWLDCVQATTWVFGFEAGDLLVKQASEDNSAYGTDNEYQWIPRAGQVRSTAVNPNQVAAYNVKVENDGNVGRTFVVKAEETAETGWQVVYRNGSAQDVTAEILSANGYTTGTLPGGGSEVITVEMKPLSTSTPGTAKTTVLRLFHDKDATGWYDAVQASTWVFGFELGDLLVKQGSELDTAYGIDDGYQWIPQGGQVDSVAVNPNQVAAYNVKVQNDGNIARTFVVKAEETAETGWQVTYRNGSAQDVTAEILSANGYTTGTLAGGGSEVITVEMKPTVNAAPGTAKTTVLRLFHDKDATGWYDAVQASTWVFGMELGDLLVKQGSEPDALFGVDGEYQWMPSGNQVEVLAVNMNATATYQVKVENDGNVARDFVVKAAETAETGWTITYKVGVSDITSQVTGTGYTAVNLAPGASEVITVEMTPVTATGGTPKTAVMRVYPSLGAVDGWDAVQVTTWVFGS